MYPSVKADGLIEARLIAALGVDPWHLTPLMYPSVKADGLIEASRWRAASS